MSSQPVSQWSVDDVVAMLHQLSLGHVAQPFRDNGISGRVLVLLEEAEYTQDLGLTHLQAKNILSHLKSLGVTPPPTGGAFGASAPSDTSSARATSPPPAPSAADQAAERARQAHYQAGMMLRDSLADLQNAEQILAKDKRLATGVLGVDALGIGLGAGFGGFGGALDGNFAGDAVTLFADMKEQSMAQARFSCTMEADRLVQSAAGRIMQAKQLAPDLPQIDLAVVQSLQNGIYLDIISGALSEFIIREKLQKSLESIRFMQSQVFGATQWLAQAYGLPHSSVMQPGFGPPGYGQQPPYGAAGGAPPYSSGQYGGQYGAPAGGPYGGGGYGQQPYGGAYGQQPYGGYGASNAPGAGYGYQQQGQISQDDGCSIM